MTSLSSVDGGGEIQLHATASQACLSCRKQKRKCDKALPSCSLCVRTRKACDYHSDATYHPSADDFALLRQKVIDLEARLQSSSSTNGSHEDPSSSTNGSYTTSSPSLKSSTTPFPSIFFLDNEIFQRARIDIEKPSASIPSEVHGYLGTTDDIYRMLEQYFSTVHMWLPIVSKKRLELNLRNIDATLQTDLALLLLSMKLMIRPRPESPQEAQDSFYYTLRSFNCMMVANGSLNMQVMQSHVLMTAYEIGHGIYPAAYLDAGYCARLGHALGIHDSQAPQVLRRSGSWAETEESRRTWWAVMLLDRYVSVGSPGHPLATTDPQPMEVLPADCLTWDRGEMTTLEPMYVSTATTVKVGPFARTCQVTHLLGRLVHLLNDQVVDAPLRFEEAIQLHRTLIAFARLLPDEVSRDPTRCGTAMALCYGSLVHLYDPYSCTHGNRGEHTLAQIEMQDVSITGIRKIAEEVLHFSRSLRSDMATHLSAASPLVADCLYMAAATYSWLVYETGEAEMVAAYQSLKDVLRILNNRWAVAGEYLKVLEASRNSLYNGSQLLR